MTTNRQILANRQNSRRSTGPKSQNGKANSKMNAMKHGLLAEQVVVRGENPAEFAGFHESLIDEFYPQGPLEEHLVERVAACMWQIRRLYRIEAEIFNYEILTIELKNASEEVAKSEKTGSDLTLPALDRTFMDKERHDRATTRFDNANRLAQKEAGSLGAAFRRDAENAGAISKLLRYGAAIERSLYRALHELQRVQAARENGQQPPSIAVDVTVDGPGPAPDSID